MRINFTLKNIGIKTLIYKLKSTVHKRGWRERMINITEDTECFFNLSFKNTTIRFSMVVSHSAQRGF